MLSTQGLRPRGSLRAVQIKQRHGPARKSQLLRSGPTDALSRTRDDDNRCAAHEATQPGMSVARIRRVSCAVIKCPEACK